MFNSRILSVMITTFMMIQCYHQVEAINVDQENGLFYPYIRNLQYPTFIDDTVLDVMRQSKNLVSVYFYWTRESSKDKQPLFDFQQVYDDNLNDKKHNASSHPHKRRACEMRCLLSSIASQSRMNNKDLHKDNPFENTCQSLEIRKNTLTCLETEKCLKSGKFMNVWETHCESMTFFSNAEVFEWFEFSQPLFTAKPLEYSLRKPSWPGVSDLIQTFENWGLTAIHGKDKLENKTNERENLAGIGNGEEDISDHEINENSIPLDDDDDDDIFWDGENIDFDHPVRILSGKEQNENTDKNESDIRNQETFMEANQDDDDFHSTSDDEFDVDWDEMNRLVEENQEVLEGQKKLGKPSVSEENQKDSLLSEESKFDDHSSQEDFTRTIPNPLGSEKKSQNNHASDSFEIRDKEDGNTDGSPNSSSDGGVAHEKQCKLACKERTKQCKVTCQAFCGENTDCREGCIQGCEEEWCTETMIQFCVYNLLTGHEPFAPAMIKDDSSFSSSTSRHQDAEQGPSHKDQAKDSTFFAESPIDHGNEDGSPEKVYSYDSLIDSNSTDHQGSWMKAGDPASTVIQQLHEFTLSELESQCQLTCKENTRKCEKACPEFCTGNTNCIEGCIEGCGKEWCKKEMIDFCVDDLKKSASSPESAYSYDHTLHRHDSMAVNMAKIVDELLRDQEEEERKGEEMKIDDESMESEKCKRCEKDIQSCEKVCGSLCGSGDENCLSSCMEECPMEFCSASLMTCDQENQTGNLMTGAQKLTMSTLKRKETNHEPRTIQGSMVIAFLFTLNIFLLF